MIGLFLNTGVRLFVVASEETAPFTDATIVDEITGCAGHVPRNTFSVNVAAGREEGGVIVVS